MSNKSERIVYLDYLRVFATIGVFFLHVASQKWDYVDINLHNWKVLNMYDSAVRWTVPIFVMISGILFLNREISLKKIYSKYILRMATSFVFWFSLPIILASGGLIERLNVATDKGSHLWFILMIIGIYACIPFAKLIVSNEKTTRYYLGLWLFFAFVFPWCIMVGIDFGTDRIIALSRKINEIYTNMNMQFVIGYIGYFIFGYYLNKLDLKKYQRMIIYFLGIVGFFMTMNMNYIVATRYQFYSSNYYGNFTVNVLFEVVAVFTLFKYSNVFKKESRFINKLSKYSFGAYCTQLLVLNFIADVLLIDTLSFNTYCSVPCLTIVLAICSFIISAILNKIPILNKYIV